MPAAVIGSIFPAGAALPLTLSFPGATVQTAAEAENLTDFALPVGPWTSEGITSKAFEGRLQRTSWRIDAATGTTLELLAPLRQQLEAEGFLILFECATEACGGFDFRYGLPVLPEPDMHIDLGDFRFLSAVRGADQAVTVLVSRSSSAGYVQVTSLGVATAGPVAADDPPPLVQPDAPPITDAPISGIGERIERTGSATLDDLTFESGSARLGAGEFASLQDLAAYLRANPQRNVTLVGHTDATGGLASNIALSKARAASVRDRLISTFAIPSGQISAEGAGYLAPRDSNLTADGRARNRRVEVILTSTQ